jgi:hypothetical protein
MPSPPKPPASASKLPHYDFAASEIFAADRAKKAAFSVKK